MDDGDDVDNSESFVGILQIYVHHARNIHNICIYDNQDVYAKFSLTYNPDHTLSTRIVNGGGKNPEFNDKIAMRVAQVDAVIGKGEVSQDYSLSSTDLFHSPAGTVKLTLCLTPSSSPPSSAVSGEGNQSSSSSGGCPDTPTSRKGSVIRDEKDGKEDGNGSKMIDGKYGEMFAAAAPPPALIPNINSGAEESAMQQQIVDMYMRSMQQFTESLAKMKLPMDLDKPGVGGGNDLSRDDNDRQKKKKDGSRVFYGSRAFF
ncbi:hypothetical protein LINPERPRIM_LOCUS7434 [Linum perenne]